MDILQIIEIESLVYCTERADLLFTPCFNAMFECLADDGLNAIEWCRENILDFYKGI